MNYWPLSVILNSPLMPSVYAIEVQNIYNAPPSMLAYEACAEVARHTKPMHTRLVMIESQDSAARYSYFDEPPPEEFTRLERAGVIQNKDGQMYVVMGVLQ